MRSDSFVYMAYTPHIDGNIGSEMQIEKNEEINLEAIVKSVRNVYGDKEAKKVPEILDAANYIRKWYTYLDNNGEIDSLKNYLRKKGLNPVEPETFSACTGLDKKVRAYSTENLKTRYKKAKLSSIGLPTDYENKVLKDEKSLRLSRKQVMQFYIEHELLHMALGHEPGYKGDLDYSVKEGEVAFHQFKHYKEEYKKSGDNHYIPLAKLAAKQYVEHSIAQAYIMKDSNLLNSKDLIEAAITSNMLVPLLYVASKLPTKPIN